MACRMAAMRFMWQLGGYGVGVHVWVVFVWEEGCGKTTCFTSLRRGLCSQIISWKSRKVSSFDTFCDAPVEFLSSSPLAYLYRSTLSLLLRNKAHIPWCGQKRIIDNLQSFFEVPACGWPNERWCGGGGYRDRSIPALSEPCRIFGKRYHP